MKRFEQFCLAFGLVLMVASGLSTAAWAGPPTGGSLAQWRAAIAHVPSPGRGCFHATFPAVEWRPAPCAVAPNTPFLPSAGRTRSGRAAPSTVGGGSDEYSAKVSGLIRQATGSFDDVSAGITEQGQFSNSGVTIPNAFSLQLNSQFFSSPSCSKATRPAKCQGWQQFIYALVPNNDDTAYTGLVFMQYWLIDYGPAGCPSRWTSYYSAPYYYCYTNSKAAKSKVLTAQQLGSVELVGSAASGGADSVSLSEGSGQATRVTGADSMVDLAKAWDTTEWGVFGDGGGGEADFNTGASLEAQTNLQDGSASAPSCAPGGFTAETNNLSLASTVAPSTEPSPTMLSRQVYGGSGNPSCATSPSGPPSTTALSLSRRTATYGGEGAVTFSATVGPDSPSAPAGTVKVRSGATTLCTITLAGGRGHCSPRATALPAGRHDVVATYGGDPAYAGSTSSTQVLTVTRAPTVAKLSLSASKVVYGAEQEEHVKVVVSSHRAGAPSGTVDVESGGHLVCKVTLRSGAGSCSPGRKALSPGRHAVVAVYGGRPNFSASKSAAGALTVERS